MENYVLDTIGGIILLVIFFGLSQRHDRRRHVPIMLTAFVADLAMVLYIELTRGAVAQVAAPETGILAIHIAFSVATMLGWIGQLVTGVTLLRTNAKVMRTVHKWIAAFFIVARVGNFITSWWVGAA